MATSARTRARMAAVLLAIIAMVVNSVSVSAHDNVMGKWCYPMWQKNGFQFWVEFIDSSSVPAGAFRDRISDGRSSWNAVNRQLWFSWNQSSTLYGFYESYAPLWWPFTGSWALSQDNQDNHCPGAVTGGWTTYNSTPPLSATWYTGTGSPGSGQVDLWSIATHEFGHHVLLNESNQSADVMYGSISTGVTKRTLTAHDRDGISWLYLAH